MTSPARAPSAAAAERRRHHLPRFRWILLGLVVALGALWLAPTIAAFVGDLDFEGLRHPYPVIAGFVILDAVIPIFPSESLLTTASNLAAQDGSDLEVWKLILAGAVGATIGDSILYWLSRTVLPTFMADRIDQAARNPRVVQSLEVLSGKAPVLIVFGRFVPGMRFVVGATMGLTRYRYRNFLLWDAIGGTFWATFTCVFSYLVASVLDDKPVLSIAVSVVVTTALLALLYKPLKKSWESAATEPVATEAAP